MKKLLLNLLFIFATVVSFAQSLPNVWFPTAGTTTAYTVNVTNYGAAYNNKLAFVQFTAENTGPATININGLGPKGLRLWDGTNWVVLVAGDLADSTRCILAYNQQSGYMEVTKLRNEGSGGGGTQDFQSVMDEGASANIGDAGADLTAEDASYYSQWTLNPNTAYIATSNLANTQGAQISTNPSGIQIDETFGAGVAITTTGQLTGTTAGVNLSASGGGASSSLIATTAEGRIEFDDGAGNTGRIVMDASGNRLEGDGFNLGTPSAATLTNATGLPWLTGITGTPTTLSGYGITDASPLYTTHNRQTASYPLVLSDVGKTVEMNVASANDLTVPANSSVAFPVGTRITVVQYGSGLTTVVASGGVTLRSSSGLLTSPGQFVPMVLQKIATDEWYLWNGTQAGTFAGTYTPTLTSVANVSASTAYVCMYMRVGNVVTVSGRIDIDPTTTTTATQLGISLPVASNFTSTDQSGGTAAATAIAGQSAAIRSDATNDRAELIYNAVDITNQSMYFTFTYQVL